MIMRVIEQTTLLLPVYTIIWRGRYSTCILQEMKNFLTKDNLDTGEIKSFHLLQYLVSVVQRVRIGRFSAGILLNEC